MQLHHFSTSNIISIDQKKVEVVEEGSSSDVHVRGREGGREEGRKGGTYRRSMEMASWKASKTVAKISSFWEGGKEEGWGKMRY